MTVLSRTLGSFAFLTTMAGALTATLFGGCSGDLVDMEPNGPTTGSGAPHGPKLPPGETPPNVGPGPVAMGVPGVACDPAADRRLGVRLWRLTDEQHAAAVATLLPGVTVRKVTTPGGNTGDFISEAGSLTVSPPLVRAFQSAAKDAASQATVKVETLLACGAGQAERACVEAFVDRFAGRAFRRPVDAMERTKLLALFDMGRADSLAQGVRVVIEAVLQAPSFLYRQELGGAAVKAVVKLTPFELASAVAFTLTGTIPDADLWKTAADGTLAQPKVLEQQVDRLLASPQAREQIGRTITGWAGLTGGVTTELSQMEYPQYDEALRASMEGEVKRFVDRLVTDGGSVKDLLTSRRSSADAKVASVYGVPFSGTAIKDVMLPEHRSGLLTTPGLLTSLAGGQPVVYRGLFMRTRLLCGELAEPPVGVELTQKIQGSTSRELAEERAANAVCGACHALMDPLGLGLSNYDDIGRYQTTELGKPIDASGALTGTDVDGPFKNGVELMNRLAGSRQVSACVTKSLMSTMLGWDMRTEPRCEPARISPPGTPLIDVARAIVLSPTFQERTQGAVNP